MPSFVFMFQVETVTLDGREITNIFFWIPPDTLLEVTMDTIKRVNSTVTRRFLAQGINLSMEAKGVRANSVFSRAIEKETINITE